jgi:hypothetical protein
LEEWLKEDFLMAGARASLGEASTPSHDDGQSFRIMEAASTIMEDVPFASGILGKWARIVT